MKVKWKVESKVDAVKDIAEKLDGASSSAGIWGEDDQEQAKKANVHEYGATIQGAFGNPDTTVVIPPRPFFKPGVENHIGFYRKIIAAGLEPVLMGNTNADNLLEAVAEAMVSKIQGEVGEHGPPLADSTKRMRRHGGTKPLIDTGTMRRAIIPKVTN